MLKARLDVDFGQELLLIHGFDYETPWNFVEVLDYSPVYPASERPQLDNPDHSQFVELIIGF